MLGIPQVTMAAITMGLMLFMALDITIIRGTIAIIITITTHGAFRYDIIPGMAGVLVLGTALLTAGMGIVIGVLAIITGAHRTTGPRITTAGIIKEELIPCTEEEMA